MKKIKGIIAAVCLFVAISAIVSVLLIMLADAVSPPKERSSYALEVHFSNGSKMGFLITAPSGQRVYLHNGCVTMAYYGDIACNVAWYSFLSETKIKE